MTLHVHLYGTHLASITPARIPSVAFTDAALERWGAGSRIFSLSSPLASLDRKPHRERRWNVLTELLPEGPTRTQLAAQAGVPESDALALLARYGADIAGALTIGYHPMSAPSGGAYTELSDAEIARLLTQPHLTPLANHPVQGKTSLAGVQGKILLASQDGRWCQAKSGAASTHILKPPNPLWPTMIHDEDVGQRLMFSLDLAPTPTRIDVFDGVTALVIERYDRLGGDRVHQEDANQALGASGVQKYQEHGGRVSLSRIAAALTEHADVASLPRLARIVTCATALGNLDLHAKNISVLHHAHGSCTLAPAYDTVPMAHLPNDGRMAMAIHGEYAHSQLTAHHLVEEITGWGLPESAALVTSTLQDLRAQLTHVDPSPAAHPGLLDDIGTFCDRLLAGERCSSPVSTPPK